MSNWIFLADTYRSIERWQRRRNMRQRSSRSVVHKDPVMCLDQIRQLLAGQQQLERAALAWCPLYESQLLQAQDHLMD
jgi:hypothetical protein